MKVIINPDEEYVKAIREKIKENDGYCPCSFIKSFDTKCPCKDFRENKNCKCRLYIKEEDK